MSRRRPDHSADMRGERGRRGRRRRGRRRLVRGAIRTVFWTLVLAGVFVLGLGYGRTIGGDEETRRDQVTVTGDLGAVQATLPTRTETVTRTVTTPAPRRPAGAVVRQRPTGDRPVR